MGGCFVEVLLRRTELLAPINQVDGGDLVVNFEWCQSQRSVSRREHTDCACRIEYGVYHQRVNVKSICPKLTIEAVLSRWQTARSRSRDNGNGRDTM